MPYPTGRILFGDVFQAMNCLATIVQSLRDKPFRVLIILSSSQREKTAPSIQLFYRAAIS